MKKDILTYRKTIETLIEDARRNGMDIRLEKNDFNDLEVMIVDKKTNEKCRVRKLMLAV